MKVTEIVVTVYINEYKSHSESIYDDGSCIYGEFEVEETKNLVEEIGYDYTHVDKWVENKLETIYKNGDWYLDPIDQVEIKNFRVPAKKIEGEWHINEI